MHRTLSGALLIALASLAAQPPTGSPAAGVRRLPRIGSTVRLSTGTTALGGRSIPLLPSDSAVAVLVTTAECSRARIGIAAFRRLAEELRRSGVAFRVVVRSPPRAARQYARLLPGTEGVLADPTGEILGPLNTRAVPSLLVLDRDGTLVAALTPLSVREDDATDVASDVVRAVAVPYHSVAAR